MRDWCTKELGDFAEIKIGGTPSRAVSDYWADNNDDGLPWVSIADLKGRFLDRTKERITTRGVIASNVKRIPANTLLMSFKLSIGRAAISTTELYTNEAIAAIVPAAEVISTDYLYYLLPPIALSAITDTAVKGSTLNKVSLRKLLLAFPRDKKKQKKIAIILQTIDEAIEKTEALIEKYSQIKTGMMQDLFTRGLTAEGKLRPTRSEAPELYQETLIGWIPKEWECAELEAVLAPVPNNIRSGPFGSALLKSELVEEGIPFLGIDNIHVERFDAKYKRFVSERKFNELQRYGVRPEDVVITIMGTVGRCAVIPRDIERALSSKHLWTMTFDQGAVIPELVCWQLNYAPWVKAWFRRETQGGIMDAIQSRTLRTLKLPLPPLPEQQLIMKRFDVLQGTLRTETENLAKLRHQKSGLMHDLLTGERPVKVDDPELADV